MCAGQTGARAKINGKDGRGSSWRRFRAFAVSGYSWRCRTCRGFFTIDNDGLGDDVMANRRLMIVLWWLVALVLLGGGVVSYRVGMSVSSFERRAGSIPVSSTNGHPIRAVWRVVLGPTGAPSGWVAPDRNFRMTAELSRELTQGLNPEYWPELDKAQSLAHAHQIRNSLLRYEGARRAVLDRGMGRDQWALLYGLSVCAFAVWLVCGAIVCFGRAAKAKSRSAVVLTIVGIRRLFQASRTRVGDEASRLMRDVRQHEAQSRKGDDESPP